MLYAANAVLLFAFATLTLAPRVLFVIWSIVLYCNLYGAVPVYFTLLQESFGAESFAITCRFLILADVLGSIVFALIFTACFSSFGYSAMFWVLGGTQSAGVLLSILLDALEYRPFFTSHEMELTGL